MASSITWMAYLCFTWGGHAHLGGAVLVDVDHLGRVAARQQLLRCLVRAAAGTANAELVAGAGVAVANRQLQTRTVER